MFLSPLLGTLPVTALTEAFGAPFAVGFAAVLAALIVVLFYTLSPSLRKMAASVKNTMITW